MADQLYADIANSLAPYIRSPVVRTINRRSALMRSLRIVPVMGKNSNWDVEMDGMYAETFADGDDVSTYGSDVIKPGSLNMGLVRVNYKIGVQAIAAVQATARDSSPRQSLSPLIGRNYENGIRKWTSFVNGKLFNSTSGIIGLDTALRDDNTYAGIDRTDSANASFRANVIDPGSLTEPTLHDIRQDITVTAYRACGETPDLAFVCPELYNKIASLFDDVRRHTQDVFTTFGGRKVTLDGSIGNIVFEGCLFMKDKDATNNTIYYLNSEYVQLEYQDLTSTYPGEMADIEVRNAISPPDDGYGPFPFQLYTVHLSMTGAAHKFSTMGSLQLAVTRPNACVKRLNVAQT